MHRTAYHHEPLITYVRRMRCAAVESDHQRATDNELKQHRSSLDNFEAKRVLQTKSLVAFLGLDEAREAIKKIGKMVEFV